MRNHVITLIFTAFFIAPIEVQAGDFVAPGWYVVMDRGAYFGKERYGIINGPYSDTYACKQEAERISDESELYMECVYLSEPPLNGL